MHGADYFRRWHSHKENSGGLMVHKATHHFDLVNWWLSAVPVTVSASGKRDFYTPADGEAPRPREPPRALPHLPREGASAPSSWTWPPSRDLKALYLDKEHHDGYFRDRCVFRPDIDIEDTMNVS